MVKEWICPKCKNKTKDFPALSRRDNKTKICSTCGSMEALNDLANGLFK